MSDTSETRTERTGEGLGFLGMIAEWSEKLPSDAEGQRAETDQSRTVSGDDSE